MGFAFKRAVDFVAILALACAGALAQDAPPTSRAEEIQRQRLEKAQNLEPARPDPIEEKILLFEQRQILEKLGQGTDGFFPKLGGLATGQGVALGFQYSKNNLADGKVRLSAFGVASFAKSQRYAIAFSPPDLPDAKLDWKLSAERRTLTRADFYGLGPESRVEDRTNFQVEDTAFDASVALKAAQSRFRLGARGGYLQTNAGEGFPRGGLPTTSAVFSAAQLPGLEAQGDFARFGAFALLDLRDNKSLARSGTLLRTELTTYQDLDLGRHDFNKWETEIQHYIPFFNRRRVIALRARTELNFTRDGQSVPFYMKPFIGGPQELRGFRNYRFYDDNILVLNAEYRWEAFSGLDMALFVDGGQAVASRRDFAWDKMETAAGVGFRFNVRNATFLRLDLAFSHESARLWLRWGSPF
jgi:outer membrane protein assembly factor BamA